MHLQLRLITFCVLFSFAFGVVLPLAPVRAASATLFLSPATASVAVNKTLTVKVLVNSGGGVGINAAEGTITYDPAYLSVSGLSQGGSIFKLWTADPAFSNTTGKITFGGGSPTAYKDSAGTIFTISFTAKQVGTTAVKWTAGSVLAADGRGTNVYGGASGGNYTITAASDAPKPKPETPATEPVQKGLLPPLPEVNSPTHPETDTWYRNNQPEFGWKMIADLTGVSFSLTTEVSADPDTKTEGIIETTALDKTQDGEWYFHIKYQNKSGWGQVAHRKVRIDATPPEPFSIVLDNDNDTTNPAPKLRFQAVDKASGIAEYRATIGLETKSMKPEEVALGYYQLSPLAPGQYTVGIAAVDRAGNSASSSLTFGIDPLKAPIIESVPKVIDKREELIVRGTSFYPRVTIKVYIGKPDKDPVEGTVMTDDNGNWSYFHRGELEKGAYDVWAKLIDSRGAQSLDSTRHLLTVISPSIIEVYGLWIILLLLAIIILLVLYIIYLKRTFTAEKMRIRAETEEVKRKLSKIFAALREEVDELIELADKKSGLSDSERRVKEKLQESLDISEEFIAKEVEDVEKEIKLKKEANI